MWSFRMQVCIHYLYYYFLQFPDWICRPEAGGRTGRDPSSHSDRQCPILWVRYWSFEPQQRPRVFKQWCWSFTRGGWEISQRAVTQRGRSPQPFPPAQTTALPRELQLQHEVSNTWVQLTGWGQKCWKAFLWLRCPAPVDQLWDFCLTSPFLFFSQVI